MDRLRRSLAFRRLPRRHLAGWQEAVVVPLLEPEHTRHALDVACQLASERRSRVLLLAPLYVEWELPLDAHFHDEEAKLRAELVRERALAESYGVSAHTEVVRVRPGELGRGIAEAATEVSASLIVIGAAADAQRPFGRPFSPEVWSVLQDAPCPVMIDSGPPSPAESAA